MGNPHIPKSVKYFAGLIFANELSLHEAMGELTNFIGRIEETTTGVPHAMASSTQRPKPSLTEAKASVVAKR